MENRAAVSAVGITAAATAAREEGPFGCARKIRRDSERFVYVGIERTDVPLPVPLCFAINACWRSMLPRDAGGKARDQSSIIDVGASSTGKQKIDRRQFDLTTEIPLVGLKLKICLRHRNSCGGVPSLIESG